VDVSTARLVGWMWFHTWRLYDAYTDYHLLEMSISARNWRTLCPVPVSQIKISEVSLLWIRWVKKTGQNMGK